MNAAGRSRGAAVNPVAAAAMAERGIDIAAQEPRRLGDETLRGVDLVVTMGCGDACPVVPGVRYVDWDLPDPTDRPIEAVRPIRDEIERRVRGLAGGLSIAAP